jgi:hypothetical protein
MRANIYKIFWSDDPDNFYIGSTSRTLSWRMAEHRRDAKNGSDRNIYKMIREKGYNFEYELIATKIVAITDQKRALEQKYIRKLKPPLNMCKSYLTKEEKRTYMETYRKTYDRTKEKAKAAGYCYECKKHFARLDRHEKLQKHKDNWDKMFKEVFLEE